jgi:hypothetical protein
MAIPVMSKQKPKAKWFKIKDDLFHSISISCQLTTGSHGDINISVDLNVYPGYRQYFYDQFDKMYSSQNGQQSYKKDYIFDITTPYWRGMGCGIKSMDINTNGILNLDIYCDYIDQENIQERRENIINDILNETSDDKNNIN